MYANNGQRPITSLRTHKIPFFICSIRFTHHACYRIWIRKYIYYKSDRGLLLLTLYFDNTKKKKRRNRTLFSAELRIYAKELPLVHKKVLVMLRDCNPDMNFLSCRWWVFFMWLQLNMPFKIIPNFTDISLTNEPWL